ncbi:MAG: hypothetical protein M4579_005605 [Chaenotheca gracillima]|nr:MAG: hypothetical protein M4579_005605 [Chaenotheca gracillima]
MSKRLAALEAQDLKSQSSKRQKLEPKAKAPKAEEITSVTQLRELLRFHQDSVAEYRHGVQSFRAFLKSIGKNVAPAKEAILREYLESQRPRDEQDQDHVYLNDLIQAWNFASFSHEDSLLAAIPASLALLLETVSSKIDFREHGTLLCKTLLRIPQLRVIARGLSSSSGKAYLVSPCLWLLTEIVSFDGGVLAKRLYSYREFTFKSLARNLSLRGSPEDDEGEKRRKPSVRTNAIRFLLANFKYQDADGKSDLLGYRDLISALLRDLEWDSPEMVITVLSSLKEYLLLDKTLTRKEKSRLLTEWSLRRISTLYDFEENTNYSSEKSAEVVTVVHNFLILVCTSPAAGVLRPETGWYPVGTGSPHELDEADTEDQESDRDDASSLAGTSVQEPLQKYQHGVPIRNTVISTFIHTLRPYANTLHSELILKIFKAAPELAAVYFTKMRNFSFDPKLSSTWIGYAAFIFSTIQIPIPAYFGQQEGYAPKPPPVQIMIESILPRPLSRQVLTRCFNQNSPLVSLFAIRVVTAALEKLRKTLQLLRSRSLLSSVDSIQWVDVMNSLKDDFTRRGPLVKDIIPAFRTVPEQNILQRESFARLLASYYEVLPQAALESSLDISVILSKALGEAESASESSEDRMHLLELKHLLRIAQCSLSMRWWSKPKSAQYSPYITMLKLVSASPKGPLAPFLKHILQTQAQEVGLLQDKTKLSPIIALVTSLGDRVGSGSANSVYRFLDHCVSQFVAKPVKYHDESVQTIHKPKKSSSTGEGPISLLLFALVEQLPFFLKSSDDSTETGISICGWLAAFLNHSRSIGEDSTAISKLREVVEDELKQRDRSFLKVFKKVSSRNELSSLKQIPDLQLTSADSLEPVEQDHDAVEKRLEAERDVSSMPDLDTRSIARLLRKDVDEAVEDGDVGNVLMCLSAPDAGIRKQALNGIAKCISNLEASSYIEKDMVNLLLQETYHTAKEVVADQQFPGYLSAFAAKTLQIQISPAHWLYGKVNQFLHERPTWEIEKVPLLQKILLNPPDRDVAHYDEIRWLISVVFDGLRSPQDLDVYRHSHVFERLLALQSSPYLPSDIKTAVGRLLWRATYIDGGSTTLVTRAGVLDWLRAEQALGLGQETNPLGAFGTQLTETWDRERVDLWSNGAAAEHAYM